MKNSWTNKREIAVALLRAFAVLVLVIQLSRAGISAFTAVDDGNSWNAIVITLLQGITSAAYYGGAVFALSWIVFLVGRQDETNPANGWLDDKESAISILKIFAVLIVLLYLPIAGIGIFMGIDEGDPWYITLSSVLRCIIIAAYYGGTIFVLSWIVSLIGRQDEGNVGSGWLNNKESAISLLKFFALLIVLLQLPISAIDGYWYIDSGLPGDFTTQSILWNILQGTFQGCVIFGLAWVASLMGKPKNSESSLGNCEDLG